MFFAFFKKYGVHACKKELINNLLISAILIEIDNNPKAISPKK